MGMISKLVIKESQEELRLLAKHQSLAKNRDRILALIHIKGNIFATRDLLCHHLGYSKRSLEAMAYYLKENWIEIHVIS